MDSKNLNRQLYFLPALTSIWLVVSCTLLIWLDQKYFLISILFLLIVTVLCLSHKLRIFGWVLALIGAAIFTVIHISLSNITDYEIRIVSIGVASILGAAVLGSFTAEQLNQTSSQIYYSRKMIEELRIIDQTTGLTRFHYARKNLNTEIARSQRYGKYLCLIMARVSNWNDIVEHRGPDASQLIMSQVGEQFRKSIRSTDLAFINIEKIGVILPETRAEGAIHVAQRVVDNCSKKARVGINIGIAEFPGDAELDTELLRVAESALQISMSSGQPVVLYSEIQEEMEKDNPAEIIVNLPSRKQQVSREMEFSAQKNKLSSLVKEENTKKTPEVQPSKQGQPVKEVEKKPENQSSPAKQAPVIEQKKIPRTEEITKQTPEVQKKATQSESEERVPPFVPYATNKKTDDLYSEKNLESQRAVMEEIQIGFYGVRQIATLPEIEKAVSDLPFVSDITMVDFSNGVLLIKVTHSAENFLEVLKKNFNMAYLEIRSGNNWIEIYM